MAFILSAQVGTEPEAAFRRYNEYLERRRQDFPPGAYRLATSGWYYDGTDRRCPHDAWLESVTLCEPAMGARQEIRTVAMRMRLLGSCHDGHIEICYPCVFRYQLQLDSGAGGHRDWRYDEFRVTDDGNLLHEIEWWGGGAIARWLIEASDIEFVWRPKGHGNSDT